MEATRTRIGLRGSTASSFMPTRNPEAGRILKARAGTANDEDVDKYEAQSKSPAATGRGIRGYFFFQIVIARGGNNNCGDLIAMVTKEGTTFMISMAKE